MAADFVIGSRDPARESESMLTDQKACANNYKIDRYSKNVFEHVSTGLWGLSNICLALRSAGRDNDEDVYLPDALYLIYSVVADLAKDIDDQLDHSTIVE